MRPDCVRATVRSSRETLRSSDTGLRCSWVRQQCSRMPRPLSQQPVARSRILRGARAFGCGAHVQPGHSRVRWRASRGRRCRPDLRRSGRRVPQTGPDARQCGGRVQRCGAHGRRCGPRLRRCARRAGRCGPDAPRCGPRLRRCGRRVGRCGPDAPRCGPRWRRCFHRAWQRAGRDPGGIAGVRPGYGRLEHGAAHAGRCRARDDGATTRGSRSNRRVRDGNAHLAGRHRSVSLRDRSTDRRARPMHPGRLRAASGCPGIRSRCCEATAGVQCAHLSDPRSRGNTPCMHRSGYNGCAPGLRGEEESVGRRCRSGLPWCGVRVGWRVAGTVALLVLSGASVARGQGTPLDSGRLVRITFDSGSRLVGRLLQPAIPGNNALIICRYPGPPCSSAADSSRVRRVPISGMAALEIQHGSHAGTGALIGGLIGLGVGSFVGALRGFCDAADCGPPALVYLFGGAAGGALLGALIGGGSPRWKTAQPSLWNGTPHDR